MIEAIFIKTEIYETEVKKEVKEEAEYVGEVPLKNVKDDEKKKGQNESNGKKYACSKCPLKFERPSHLVLHESIHTGVKPFACEAQGCTKTFRLKIGLTKHMKLIHGKGQQYACSVCKKAFLSKTQMVEHTNIHTGKKPHHCPQCKKAFALKATMVTHIKTHHTNSFKCEFCNKKFPRSQTLDDHINIFHNGMQKTFTCTDCGAIFGSQARLNRHRKVHQEQSRLVCEFCERPFSNRENLLAHLKGMHKDKCNPYECCFCSDAFSSKDQLLSHESLAHNDIICICNNCHLKFESINEYRGHCRAHLKFSFCYKCKICDADMASKDKILEHTNAHKDITPFLCKFCPTSFSHKHLLQKHLTSNPEGRSKKCEVCDKTYQKRAHLIDHLRLHTGVRPFLCEKCPKTFRTEQIFKQHSHVHTDVKAITCDECGKFFKLRSSLVKHKWSHREVKLHPCQYCPKSFANRDKWVVHTRIHTGEKPFACDACDMKFKCKEGLTTHKWTHTGGKKPYNCLVCRKGFMRKAFLKKHDCAGSNSTNVTSDDEEDNLVLATFKNEDIEIAVSNSTNVTSDDEEDNLVLATFRNAALAIDEKINELTKRSEELKNGPAYPSDCNTLITVSSQTKIITQRTESNENQDVSPIRKLKDAGDFVCVKNSCQIVFPNFQTLSKHNQIVHNTFVQVCKICARNFENSETFDQHFHSQHLNNVMQNNDAFELKCSICTALFEHRIEMLKHAELHSKSKYERPFFECHNCGLRYRMKMTLKTHIIKVHRAPVPVCRPDLKCKNCGKQYTQKNKFIEHTNTHTGEKPFKCKLCKKSFPAARFLKNHASVHTQVKAFTCDICGKIFKLSASLTRHKWSHQVKKLHQCTHCDKSFIARHTWVKHERIHTGEKPFECEQCGLKFREKDGLTNHKWKHQKGKKPYNCTTCKKGFMRKAFLTKHICDGPDWDFDDNMTTDSTIA